MKVVKRHKLSVLSTRDIMYNLIGIINTLYIIM